MNFLIIFEIFPSELHWSILYAVPSLSSHPRDLVSLRVLISLIFKIEFIKYLSDYIGAARGDILKVPPPTQIEKHLDKNYVISDVIFAFLFQKSLKIQLLY